MEGNEMKSFFLIFMLVYLTVGCIFAIIPQEDFNVVDKCNNYIFDLGDHLSVIFDMYPSITLKGERKYSNITYREYQLEGIIFSISAFAKIEREANVMKIEIFSSNYSTGRGIVVGNSKDDVLSKYGAPDRIQDNSYYYRNTEGDSLALIFNFDEKEVISSIVLSGGT